MNRKPAGLGKRRRALVKRRRGSPPAEVRDILGHTGSLTQLAGRRCPERLRIEIKRQGWAPLLCDERRALRLRPGQWGWIREVLFRCRDRPWFYGRSVMTGNTLRRIRYRLRRLGARPLGALLFSMPGVAREELQARRLGRKAPLYGLAAADCQGAARRLWMRRSRFRIGGRPLLITEVILPGFCRNRGGGAPK